MKKYLFILMSILLIFVIGGVSYIYSPVTFKLNLMGFKHDDSYYFSTPSYQYEIIVNDNQLTYIEVKGISMTNSEYVSIDLQFFKNNERIVNFILHQGDHTEQGFYTLTDVVGFEGESNMSFEVTHEIITISQTAYGIIDDHIPWFWIPQSQQ